MIDAFQARALATRLQIPLIYGVDAVHGDNNLVGATIFPHNIGMGATRDPALVKQDGRDHRDRDPGDRHPRGRSRRASASPATSAGAARTSRFGEDPALVDPDGDDHRRPPG